MKPADAESGQPLGLTVHDLPAPAEALQRRRASGRFTMLLVMLACAAPVVASYLLVYGIRPDLGSAAYGHLVHPPVAMPTGSARTLDGQERPLAELRGQWLLVVADSGACRQACERHLFLQRQLREMLGRERDRVDKLWLVLDDAPVSPALRQALDATPALHVRRLPREQAAAWLRPEAGHRLEDHLYIVDPMGQWMMRSPADPDPARVKRDVDRLLRASASWDQAGRPTDPPAAR